ncbi:MAG TPA: DUF6306 domain-containing protein [Alphaproteobacteria bacterium]|nr:DUF6306 domain-containing protein [Alphaproteobacteria bacterium]
MAVKKQPDDAGEPEPAKGFSSPACLAHEMDPAYAGYLGDAELVALLNLLVEAERAGDKVLGVFLAESPSAEARALLEAVRRDEARFTTMLTRHIEKLGGAPSQATGAFYGKAIAVEGFAARLAFLNRGQGWVVRKLKDALPRVKDDRLHSALKGMLGAHEANIARCEALVRSLG